MRKFICFLAWWATAICGFLLAFSFYETLGASLKGSEPTPIWKLILSGILFIMSGIFRRVFHIKDFEIGKRGLMQSILIRINCKRFYISFFFYATIFALVWGLIIIAFSNDLFKGLIVTVVSFIAFSIARAFLSLTCSGCGYSLSYDESDYDDNVVIEETSSSATAYRYSTDFYHCPRCGKRKRMRTKHTAAKVNYR